MHIRNAEITDLEALLDIYNYEVEHGTATFDTEPRTYEQRKEWFYEHNIDNHPLIVADMDGQAVGYASLSAYRPKDAYRSTVELSVYVDPGYRGKGIASRLMTAILEMARDDDRTHLVISVITGSNAASIHLHEKLGFTYSGTIREVGFKHGQYLDIVHYTLPV